LLTLTIPNVPGDEIGEAIMALHQGFQRLCRTRAVKRIIVGYLRALEITRNKTLRNLHPHLHVLMAVRPDYFDRKFLWCISHEQWLQHWRSAMRNPAITSVHVCKVKPRKTGDDRIAGAAAEVAKYTVTGERSTQTSIRPIAIKVGYNRWPREGAPVLQTTWKTNYKNHVIELENRPWRERLLVDGKEVARQAGATFLHRTFEAEIADGGKNVPVQVTTSWSKQPRGIRCAVSVGGAPIYDEVKWPARWYIALSAFAVAVAAAVLRMFGH
jgi:hypothetical protein